MGEELVRDTEFGKHLNVGELEQDDEILDEGGNGAYPAEMTIEPEEEMSPEMSPSAVSEEEQRLFEERELEKSIPGRGHLFRIPNKHLPEATELREAEILGFAIGDAQQQLYNFSRIESVFDIIKYSIMRYRISKDRKGREEDILINQFQADDRAAAADGGLIDTP